MTMTVESQSLDFEDQPAILEKQPKIIPTSLEECEQEQYRVSRHGDPRQGALAWGFWTGLALALTWRLCPRMRP